MRPVGVVALRRPAFGALGKAATRIVAKIAWQHYLGRVGVCVVPKRSEKAWAIYRLSARAIYLGQVTAPAEDKANKVAIKEIPVTNPEHQKRLVARKAA